MQALWNRIETWFERYVPQKRTAFQPGASDDAIRQAEVAMNVHLPEDVKASYRLHNGSAQQNLIGDGDLQFHNLWALNSLEEIVSNWNMLRSVRADLFAMNQDDFFEEVNEHPLGTIWWHSKWIPLLNLGNGDMICIDLAPEVGGQSGRVFSRPKEGGNFTEVIAPSWQAFLATFADDLEAGVYLPELHSTH